MDTQKEQKNCRKKRIFKKRVTVLTMMQGFASQLIPGEVSSDIGTTNRHEIPELCISHKISSLYIALDQNFNNHSGINYVSIGVPSDLSLSKV